MIVMEGLPTSVGYYWHRQATARDWAIVYYDHDGYWVAIEHFGGDNFVSFFVDDPDIDVNHWEWVGPLRPPSD